MSAGTTGPFPRTAVTGRWRRLLGRGFRPWSGSDAAATAGSPGGRTPAAPPVTHEPPVLRTGIDLVTVADVAAAVAAHGDRYVDRVYTARERADCHDAHGADVAERLAGRFAAKEAAVKVLRPAPDTAVPWTTVEVVRGDAGEALLRWHGTAARLAARAGLGPVALSLTHERGTAAAVAVAHVRRLPVEPPYAPTAGADRVPAMTAETTDTIRHVLADHARLTGDAGELGVDDDLYRAGMTSHASVTVMLALEEAFDVEFPDELLARSVFETIASISRAVEGLRDTP